MLLSRISSKLINFTEEEYIKEGKTIKEKTRSRKGKREKKNYFNLYIFPYNLAKIYYGFNLSSPFLYLGLSQVINTTYSMQCLGSFPFLRKRFLDHYLGSVAPRENTCMATQAIKGFFSL